MLNMVRAELYRMAHARMTWVFLIVIAAPTALSAVAAAVVLGDAGLVSFLESTSSDISRVLDASTGQASVLSLYGSSFVNGSFVAMAACCYVALFAAKGVGDGKRAAFAKNLVQAQGGRTAYAIAQIAIAAVAAALFVAVGIASCALFYGLAGFSVLPGSFAELALWAALGGCCVLAYEAVTLVLALATGSEAAAVVLGLFLGGFAVEGAVSMAVGALAYALSPLPWLEGAASFIADWSLMAQLQLLGHGELCGAGLYAVAGAVVAVAAAASIAVMRRRSLG